MIRQEGEWSYFKPRAKVTERRIQRPCLTLWEFYFAPSFRVNVKVKVGVTLGFLESRTDRWINSTETGEAERERESVRENHGGQLAVGV